MTVSRRDFVASSLAVGMFGNVAAQARKELPATIKLVVPYGPGGAVDMVSRIVSDRLQQKLGRTVLVDNRPGAGGRIAMAQIKRGPADGSEVIIAPNGLTTLQSLVYASQINYSVLDDFVPVAKVVRHPMALTVNAASPVKTAQELKSLVVARPDQANFGTAATGGMAHFAGLGFAKAGGFTWTQVGLNRPGIPGGQLV